MHLQALRAHPPSEIPLSGASKPPSHPPDLRVYGLPQASFPGRPQPDHHTLPRSSPPGLPPRPPPAALPPAHQPESSQGLGLPAAPLRRRGRRSRHEGSPGRARRLPSAAGWAWPTPQAGAARAAAPPPPSRRGGGTERVPSTRRRAAAGRRLCAGALLPPARRVTAAHAAGQRFDPARMPSAAGVGG